MGIQRDGARHGDPTATPPSSPTSATAPRARATSTRPSSSPRPTTRRSSSSARTTSGPSPSRTERQTRVPLYQRAARLRLPGHPGRRQRRARRLRGHQGGARARPRAAAARRSSRPSPTAWARTRPRTTRRATAIAERGSRAGSARTRSSGCRRTCRARAWPTRRSSTRSTREADAARRPRARGLPGAAGPRAARDVRPRLRRAAPADRRGAGRVRGVPRRTSRATSTRVAQLMTTRSTTGQGPQRRPAPGAWRTTPRSSSWARTSASSAASSASPTACRRTSARTGSSTPRSPSPASSAPRSAWPCAATGRSCEIQFDGFVYPAFDQIVTPGGQDAHPLAAAR